MVIPGADAGPRIGTGASGVKFGFPLPGAYSHLGRRGGAGQRRNQNQTALGRTAGEPGIVVVHLYY